MTAHFQVAPDGPFTVGALTPTTNRGYYGRFIPAGDRVLTAIQFMVASRAPTDILASVACFGIGTDGELARLSASGDVPGRLNVEPTQIDGQNLKKYSLAVPRVTVLGERVHYAAVRANGNTFQFVSAVLGKDALLECSNSQTVLGLARALEFQAPLSKVIPRPGVAYEVPLMGVSYQRRIVCLGDSITGHPGSDPLLQYPRSLGALLGPHAYVINAGVGGETAAVMLARFGSDVGSNRPLDVIVQAGVNDLAADHLRLPRSRRT